MLKDQYLIALKALKVLFPLYRNPKSVPLIYKGEMTL
jgi:hypothetical protein